jgi:predicted O-methyltransferase YrrM
VSDLDYLKRLHRNPSPLLLELEQYGRADGIPIVDRETGRLLSTLVCAMQANRILEIGTAYGYSTLWMALAMPPAGKLWTIDPDTRRTAIALEFLGRANKADAVSVINQPALEVLPTFPVRNLDIVFIDAVKTEYEAYLELVVPLLKRSGLVVVDNLLWGGESAADPSAHDSAETRALREFNRTFLNHPQLDATIVPVGDGVGIGARTASS